MRDFQKGSIPVLVLITIIGLISFLAVGSFASFNNSLFSNIFTRSPSYAATLATPIMGVETAAGAVDSGNQYQSNLRINPLNSNQISITAKNSFDETKTILFNTQDGGGNWTAVPQPVSGDPDVAYDLLGIAHWSFIDKSAGKSMGYRKSVDGGKTWSVKKNLGISVDHPHMAIDRTNSQYRGSVYIAGRDWSGGGISIAYSRDEGTTWQISRHPSPNTVLGLGFVYGIDFLKDGTILIPMTTQNTILVENGAYAGATADIYALRSVDGGQTFSEVYISPNNSSAKSGPGGFAGLSNLAVGSFEGIERVYLAYVQPQPNPNPQTLMLTVSDDGGKTWSTPRSIVPSTPTGWGAGSASIMVNSDGVMGIQYYSIKDGKFDLYFTYSQDGGTTFSTPFRVSTISSSDAPPGQPRWPGQDQVYADVAADGSFHTVWTDSRPNATKYTIFTRTISIPSTPLPTASTNTTPKPKITGDVNSSGKVDILDYNLLITDYGATAGLGLRSDLNGSGKVDILDYNLLITNYGKTSP